MRKNEFINFIKGIAIILVVFGHNIQYASGFKYYENELYFNNNIFKFIYSFHMPLFALISGYLFYYTFFNNNFKTIIKKKKKSLIIPILSWNIIDLILFLLKDFKKIKIIDILKKFLIQFFYSLWFLWAIFYSLLIVLIIEKILNNKNKILKFLTYISVITIFLFIPNKLNSNYYIYMFPYFLMGFYINKKTNNLKEYNKKSLLFYFIILFLLFCYLLSFYDKNSYIYTTLIYLLSNKTILWHLKINLYRWIIGYIGTFMIILFFLPLFKYINERIKNVICNLGKISLGIYILNFFTNKYIILKITYNFSPNFLIWVIETVASISIYYICIKIIQQSKTLNKFLLGGR